MNQSVAVYGPQGSGKTKNAKALAKHFGLTKIDDELDLRKPLDKHGTLYLTQYPVLYIRSIKIEDALKMMENK